MQRIRLLVASTASGGSIASSHNYDICGIARRARALGRSRMKVGAHITFAAPINFEIRNVRFTPKSGH